jgi:hypothetical protein
MLRIVFNAGSNEIEESISMGGKPVNEMTKKEPTAEEFF